MTRRNFFPLITSHHDVFKTRFFENKKIRVRFLIGNPPNKPAKQKKLVALENSLRLHTSGGPAAAAEAVE